MDKCASCHKQAAALWRTTVHAHAWKTLVDGGKQADYKCVGCHVTGYGEIGGSSLGHTRGLESVQCETLPRARLRARRRQGPRGAARDPPRHAGVRLHGLPQRAPLRHVPVRGLPARQSSARGTAPSARARLGGGPTGHALRGAALAKAKTGGGHTLEKL